MTGLDAIFRPRSVAIIGASNTPGKVGYILTRNMIQSGYSGKLWPINPRSESIQGLKAHKTVGDVPEDIDLAVIAIPSSLVLQVAEECGVKGIKALIVITAGFKETGHEPSIPRGHLSFPSSCVPAPVGAGRIAETVPGATPALKDRNTLLL